MFHPFSLIFVPTFAYKLSRVKCIAGFYSATRKSRNNVRDEILSTTHEVYSYVDLHEASFLSGISHKQLK